MDITKLKVDEKAVQAQEDAKHDSYYDQLRKMNVKEIARQFSKIRKR